MVKLTSLEVSQLMAQGEGQSIEFKDERIKPSDLAETLAAFANSDGGIVLTGVADDGSIVGVNDVKATTDNILIAAGRDCCDPPVVLSDLERITTSSGKTIIALRVPRSRSAVHSAQGRFLKREGSRNLTINSAALKQLFLGRGGLFSIPGSTGRHDRPQHSQMYEILRYQQTLTLQDPDGKGAILERIERVRFLQNNVIAIYDHAWGDGQLFMGYRVSPGRVADRFQAGSRYHTLISLRDTKHRGDVLTYRIRQRVINGFTTHDEWWETEVDHPTHNLELNIIFPKERHCREAQVIETSTNKQTPLPAQAFKKRRDGRQILTWSLKNPTLGERYAVQWNW